MNSYASASQPSLGDGNSNPSAFLSNEGVGLLFGQNASVVVTPPDFATAQLPKYSIGSRCRLVPQPHSEWGTIIGQIYAPVFKDLDKAKQKTAQWSWIYLILLDADSPYPQIRREQAIVSLNEDRIKAECGTEGKKIDCSRPEKEYEQNLFPTTSTFQFSKWRQEYCKYWNYAPEKLELIDKFEQEIIKRFEHYQLPVIELMASLPRPAVCQMFENVNTQNSVLTFFDLATACFAADNFSLREDWAEKEQILKKHRLLHSVRETDFLSCVTLVATYYRRQHAIKTSTPSQKLPAVACRRDEVLNLSVEEYKTFAPRVVVGYEEAVRFLHGQRIVTAEDLPYQIQLVALAAVLAVIGYPQEQVRSKLEQWFWCGDCTAFYTSWHEARASRDMLEVPDWLMGNSLVVPSTVREALFDRSFLQRTQRRHGSVYKSISALLRKNGAIDLATGEALSDVNFVVHP